MIAFKFKTAFIICTFDFSTGQQLKNRNCNIITNLHR